MKNLFEIGISAKKHNSEERPILILILAQLVMNNFQVCISLKVDNTGCIQFYFTLKEKANKYTLLPPSIYKAIFPRRNDFPITASANV